MKLILEQTDLKPSRQHHVPASVCYKDFRLAAQLAIDLLGAGDYIGSIILPSGRGIVNNAQKK